MFGTLHNGPRLDMTTETSEVWTARCPTMLWEPAEFEQKPSEPTVGAAVRGPVCQRRRSPIGRRGLSVWSLPSLLLKRKNQEKCTLLRHPESAVHRLKAS
ncbi:hypothetical protein FQA47_014631 [Oryzias melastigma]|uniref:Uncharacterized protein n=1 Tax=Oryzias melastigma TaxID=30732 RepID=A0A834FKT3_ORYME|nr:hypothetical protein FQA47_014631 [Oryzias melastigma]